MTWSGPDIAHEAGNTPVESGLFVSLPSGSTLRGSSLHARVTLHAERDDATSITQHEASNNPFASAHAREDSQKKLNPVVNTAVCEVSGRNCGSPLLRNSTSGLQWERRIGAARVDEKPFEATTAFVAMTKTDLEGCKRHDFHFSAIGRGCCLTARSPFSRPCIAVAQMHMVSRFIWLQQRRGQRKCKIFGMDEKSIVTVSSVTQDSLKPTRHRSGSEPGQ